MIAAVDLLPTFCAAAGMTLPAGYQTGWRKYAGRVGRASHRADEAAVLGVAGNRIRTRLVAAAGGARGELEVTCWSPTSSGKSSTNLAQ